MKQIYATWMLNSNIGDALTPWLIRQMTGQSPLYVPFDVEFPKYMLTGSVLNHAVTYTIVWGAGFANRSDVVRGRPEILAVRGPHTLQRVWLQCGIPVEVMGDPALLMQRFYSHVVLGRPYKVGFIPHYMHQQETAAWLDDRDDIKLINVFDTPEQFVDDLLQCEVVFSSSLHGLIIADAYGIPSQWFDATAVLGGDGSKFEDHLIIRQYLSRFGPEKGYDMLMRYARREECDPPLNVVKPHIQQLPKDVDALRAMVIENVVPDFSPIRKALMDVCPFVEHLKRPETTETTSEAMTVPAPDDYDIDKTLSKQEEQRE